MKTLIIEDEALAAQSLRSLIRELRPEMEILAILQSIDESVEWLRLHPMPDLIFMDIHLADGSSFAIFDEVEITCPVIFTTAYDEYSLKAFEVNSIDYLLKPIHKKDMERALNKYHTLTAGPLRQEVPVSERVRLLAREVPSYRSYFLVAVKDRMIPLSVKEIAYVFIDLKIVTAVTFDGRSYVLDQNLDDVFSRLDPELFFRANRQYIVARDAIRDITSWFGGKLSINLTVETTERIFVSKARVREFKDWITG